MRRVRKVALPLGVLAVVGVALAPPVIAGDVSANVIDHILTVSGTDGGESITIRCEGGEVTVNQAQPGGGPEACSTLRRILVFGEDGDDRVSLGEVGPAAFDDLDSVVVSGDAGDDTLIGSGLADELLGGGGVDSLRGGGGADELLPGPGPGEVVGGKGHDTVSVSGNGDWGVSDERIIRITPDSEEITLSSVEAAEVTGGAGDNTISGASFSGPLVLFGLRGDDLIQSGPKDDLIDGGEGGDYLDSGAGDDLIEGRTGDDVLRGGDGNDELRGGPGDDVCSSGPGADSELSC